MRSSATVTMPSAADYHSRPCHTCTADAHFEDISLRTSTDNGFLPIESFCRPDLSGLLTFFRSEVKRYRIDTVTAILWSVALTQKDMSKMRITVRADDLGSLAVFIELFFDSVFYLVIKAGPAAV